MTTARENLDIVQALDKQHPNPWQPGRWYPATYNGVAVEICRTAGKGRNGGVDYLHVRRKVRRVIKHWGSEEVTEAGTTYIHVRYNMQTGEAKEL